MARRASITPNIQLEIRIPEDLRAKLELHLWSDLEGRVPLGGYSKFFIERLKEYFDRIQPPRSV